MSARLSGSQIHFLSLQTAIFCVQCELISANTTPCCLACGSKAVLGLSRLFGGSLRAHPKARVIEDDELNRLVRDLLRTVPSDEIEAELDHAPYLPPRHHTRSSSSQIFTVQDSSQIGLEPAIGVITERAQALTGATGAAIALRRMPAERRSRTLPRCRRQSRSRSCQLPKTWGPVNSCRAFTAIPQNHGYFRGSFGGSARF
jgi:hypothetical protein